MARQRIGIWFIGARGGVATTTIVGLIALKKGLCPPFGLVSELEQFADLDLTQWDQMVFGGHEIRNTTLWKEAKAFQSTSGVFDDNVLTKCKSDLAKVDKQIKPGVLFRVGKTIEELASNEIRLIKETPKEAVERVQFDLKTFKDRNKLDQVIVINVASTEPPHELSEYPTTWKALEKTLASNSKCKLPASSLYAIAALDMGMPYLNFTPSVGSAPAAIQELAVERETCHMGHDGKTGETLMKSVLAPMFASRHLQVMSWVGHNIFGNMDGKVLDDPENKKTKVVSKDRLLRQILNYDPQTLVSIEYIESLGDWKTAWDHIHFKGFLGTPMTLQFTWQGCDSVLAAPLVIDLVRFAERASRNGDRGLLIFLASFFKSPIGIEENGFIRQFQLLEEWANEVRSRGTD